MEGDPRHAEVIIKQLELEDCAPHSTPNERMDPRKLTEDYMKELGKEGASLYGAIVARQNHLSNDRSAIRYGVKELARRMSEPRNSDYRQLIHVGSTYGEK